MAISDPGRAHHHLRLRVQLHLSGARAGRIWANPLCGVHDDRLSALVRLRRGAQQIHRPTAGEGATYYQGDVSCAGAAGGRHGGALPDPCHRLRPASGVPCHSGFVFSRLAADSDDFRAAVSVYSGTGGRPVCPMCVFTGSAANRAAQRHHLVFPHAGDLPHLDDRG